MERERKKEMKEFDRKQQDREKMKAEVAYQKEKDLGHENLVRKYNYTNMQYFLIHNRKVKD